MKIINKQRQAPKKKIGRAIMTEIGKMTAYEVQDGTGTTYYYMYFPKIRMVYLGTDISQAIVNGKKVIEEIEKNRLTKKESSGKIPELSKVE